MADFVERAVLRLRQEPGFSRNRHFAALSSPEGRKAMRVHRQLRSIERDLTGGWAVTVEQGPERIRLELKGRYGRRTTYLTVSQFRILCTNPLVRAALGAYAV